MSAARTIETRLPEVLESISNPRMPAYYDDILGQVARTRQRPGWTFPERWLPLTTLSTRLATAPRVPMRIAIALLLLLLAFAVSLLIVGSQHTSVPAPFGVAGNGKIVFADTDGSIKLGTLGDVSTTVIVPGAGHSSPTYSPDGRSLAYLQRGTGTSKDIVVSGPQGEVPHVINEAPVGPIGHLIWSPDSKSVIAVVGAQIFAFDIAKRSVPKVLFTMPLGAPEGWLDNLNANLADIFRPPNGDEILFYGSGAKGSGLYRQVLAGGPPIAVVTDGMIDSAWSSNQSGAQWSPDGKQIVLSIHPTATPDFGRAYIVNADGSGLRRVSTFEVAGSTIDEEHAAWSPDGTKIAFGRWILDAEGNNDPRPVVIVDIATGAEIEASNREVNGYESWAWSPDGSTILQVPGAGSDDAEQVIEVDPTTGQAHRLGWTSRGAASWQRTVPAR